MAIDSPRIEAAVAELLAAIGEDPARPGLQATPRRVAEAYTEFFAGVGEDPLQHLSGATDLDAGEGELGELVLLRDIQFRSICEHHLLPFTGVAHLAYAPGERIVGLGRLPRVVETLSARPQLQERLGEEIADALDAGLAPRGVLVMLDARHGCVTSRGTRQVDSTTVTVATRGTLSDPSAQSAVLATIATGGGRVTTLIMGVLNVTPDSFSDGGRWQNLDDAIAHGVAMAQAGAGIVDVGGESTRPGAVPVAAGDERKRVMPVVRELVARGITVSIDTMHASTALAAVDAGAEIINDVSGGLADDGMASVVAETGVHFVAMHWRGGADVQAGYRDVVADVRSELKSRVAQLVVAGVHPERIVLDPGLGFAKDAEHNWQLLARLDELATLGHGILIGASRKRFLGALLPQGAPMEDRDPPTAVISALAARSGVWAVRVHDVPSTRLALDVWERWQDGAST